VSFKRILVFLASVVVLAGVGCVGVSVQVGWSLTHPSRRPLEEPEGARALGIRDVSFPSRAGDVTLKGWFLPGSDSTRAIVFAHGYGDNRSEPDVPAWPIACALHDAGFGVLMFDFRASGESEGDLVTIGDREQWDLLGAADALGSDVRLGVLGWSMGGATALASLSRGAPWKAVVADSAFADLRPYLESNLAYWSHLPRFPFTPLILGVMPPVLDERPENVRASAAVAETGVPLLFIHGGADAAIPSANSEEMARAARNPASAIWIVPGAEHVGSYGVAPEAYIARILAFFGQYV